MEFFNQFPNLLYTFDPNQSEFVVLKNIFTRVKVLDAVLQNSLVYYKYSMKDGDTLESIAHKYYGDAKRHWLIIYANSIIDPYFDLPLNQANFDNNIKIKYGSLANAQATLHHINQIETVTSSVNGSSNTQVYISTLTNQPYTYDFLLNKLVPQTLPSIGFPEVIIGSVTLDLPDGTVATTDTKLEAISNYDYELGVNEGKRQIVLIDKKYAAQIENQLQQLLVA